METSKAVLFWSRLRIISLILGTVGGVLYGWFWYEQAPLREARALLADGHPLEALEVVDEWQDHHGPMGSSEAIRALCFAELGRYQETIRIFGTIGAETTEEIHAWAKACLAGKQWSQALPLLKTVHQQIPDDPDVLHELSACLAELGLYSEALEFAEKFAAFEQFEHRGRLLMGVLHRRLGNKQKVGELWQPIRDSEDWLNSLQIPPDEFLTQYAILQLDLGDPERAANALSDALRLTESAEMHYQFGLAEDQRGNPIAAEDHWVRAVSLNPEHLEAREALAKAALKSGVPAEAERLLLPILHLPSLNSSTTYLMQRLATLKNDSSGTEKWKQKTEELRRREQVRSTLTQLVRENPGSFWATVVQAYRFAEKGNWQQAEVLLARLDQKQNEEDFLAQLRTAVDSRGPLPEIELFPIQAF